MIPSPTTALDTLLVSSYNGDKALGEFNIVVAEALPILHLAAADAATGIKTVDDSLRDVGQKLIGLDLTTAKLFEAFGGNIEFVYQLIIGAFQSTALHTAPSPREFEAELLELCTDNALDVNQGILDSIAKARKLEFFGSTMTIAVISSFEDFMSWASAKEIKYKEEIPRIQDAIAMMRKITLQATLQYYTGLLENLENEISTIQSIIFNNKDDISGRVWENVRIDAISVETWLSKATSYVDQPTYMRGCLEEAAKVYRVMAEYLEDYGNESFLGHQMPVFRVCGHSEIRQSIS
ncbi:hypothetical protein C8R43DRAFT_963282 [Mycena crocata]|nr:hypothetical protein C8R43DRAFT_963282 [Mycena crocata]